MLTHSQAKNVALTVRECISNICQNRKIGTGKNAKVVPMHGTEEISVIGEMLCEALNSMQDNVKFHVMKLPTRAESEEWMRMADKIVFKDTAPEEDKLTKTKASRVCPRCEFDQIKPDHIYCMICGLKL